MGAMFLESRYRQIRQRVEAQSDFSAEELASSRALFDLEYAWPIPRRFEVWTCLAGLPVPPHLAGNLREVAAAIASLLPPEIRFYRVIPANYHWELFIIKRPTEHIPEEQLELAGEILREVLRQQEPITLSYRGFLITPDGTVLAQGFSWAGVTGVLLPNVIIPQQGDKGRRGQGDRETRVGFLYMETLTPCARSLALRYHLLRHNNPSSVIFPWEEFWILWARRALANLKT